MWARLAILGVVAVSDLVDGVWARRIGGSRAGAVLDPVADKLFVGIAFITVASSGALAPLEIVGVLLRDIVALLGFLTTLVLRRPTTMPARAGGKAVTVSQLLTLLAWALGSDLIQPMAWATAAISVYAVADYSHVAWKR
jgi:phosphatidylglycerophosphate synthase